MLALPFVVLALSAQFRQSVEFPLLAWVGVVLLIDVAHVYSTLVQTYSDP